MVIRELGPQKKLNSWSYESQVADYSYEKCNVFSNSFSKNNYLFGNVLNKKIIAQ
jgi:hypothetical protein